MAKYTHARFIFWITFLFLCAIKMVCANEIDQARDAIENLYVDKIDPEEIRGQSVQEIMANLDHASGYLNAEQWQKAKANLRGEQSGLGLDGEMINGIFVVNRIIAGGPADTSGIKIGDHILTIDDQAMQSNAQLSGSFGSAVRLKILRNNMTWFLSLERANIDQDNTIIGIRDRIGLIKLKMFDKYSAREIAQALDRLSKNLKIDTILLDLRENSGGLLDEAIKIAKMFLYDEIVVSVQSRGHDVQIQSGHGSYFKRFCVWVFVDKNTASAGEILTSALQENHIARVIGERTYGKGSVQELIETEEGGALRLTVARYKTPLGHSLEGIGIVPDVTIDPNKENALNQVLDIIQHP